MDSLHLLWVYLEVRSARDNMAKVTIQDVARVAARLMDPEKLFVTVVGAGTGLTGTE